MGIKHIVLVIKTEAEEEFKDGDEEVTIKKKKRRSAVGKFSHSIHIAICQIIGDTWSTMNQLLHVRSSQ